MKKTPKKLSSYEASFSNKTKLYDISIFAMSWRAAGFFFVFLNMSYSIIAQFKEFKDLNERISEWAYFLNLDKEFQRHLHFSVPKQGVFVDKSQRRTSYLKGTKNRILDGFL